MKYTYYIILALILSFQILGEDIYLNPNWKEGEVFDYNVRRTIIDTKTGNEDLIKDTQSSIKVQILSRTAEYSLINFFIIDSSSFTVDMVLKIDSYGDIIGIENWEEIREKAQKTFKILKESKDVATRKAAILIEPAFSSEQHIIALYAKYLESIFKFFGFELSTESPLTYQGQITNHLTLTPLITITSINIEVLDSYFNVESTTTYEESSIKSNLKNVLSKIDEISEEELNKVIEKVNFKSTVKSKIDFEHNMVTETIYTNIVNGLIETYHTTLVK